MKQARQNLIQDKMSPKAYVRLLRLWCEVRKDSFFIMTWTWLNIWHVIRLAIEDKTRWSAGRKCSGGEAFCDVGVDVEPR